MSAGDFLLGAGTRNNQSSMTVASPFSGIDLQAGNMNAEAAYLIASSDGAYQPVYQTVSAQTTLIASFAAVPATGSATVPDVLGSTQAAADSSIAAAGLVVGTVTRVYDDMVPAGNVIFQSPAGGSTTASDCSVNLVVSLGADPNPKPSVPNVAGLTLSAAQSAITGAELVVGTVTSQSDAFVPAGDVISQNPAGGSLVNAGSGVDLVVSDGPAPVADVQFWREGYPDADLSDLGADFDGDGLSNGEERIWGLNPTSANSRQPILMAPDRATGSFRYTRRDTQLTGLAYTIWTSSNLKDWMQDLGASQMPGSPDQKGSQIVDVTLSGGLLTTPSLFVQVRCTN